MIHFGGFAGGVGGDGGVSLRKKDRRICIRVVMMASQSRGDFLFIFSWVLSRNLSGEPTSTRWGYAIS